MMYPQQTSFIKRAGQGARRQFQIMHLAVFPFQAEFLKTNELETLAYFEKGNQIIGINGEKPITIPPANRGEKVRMSSLNNIIKFHVYSESNVVYKWSLYKRHASGQEEFLQSCAFNLREIVVNYILPLRGETMSMINSTIGNDFHEKQLRGKFSKTGIILNFALIISNNLAAIESHVSHRYCESVHNFKVNTQAIEITNEEIVEVSLMEERLNDYSFQSASMLSQQSLLKNQSRHDERQKAEKVVSEKMHQRNSSSHHSLPEDTIALDLDELILNEDKPKSGNSIQNIDKSQGGDDLTFGVEENETKTSIQAQKIRTEPKKPRGRDYSLLRIQSDKNGLKPELIDENLERQQLEMIEEEKTSVKGTGKPSSLQYKPLPNSENSLLPKPQPQPQPQPQKITAKPSPFSSNINFKKLILFFIAIALTFMIAAVYNYSIKKTKFKPKAKAKAKFKSKY